MRKYLFLFGFCAILFLCSCEKNELVLGEFECCEHLIDMTQKNKYEESLFCNDWIVSKVYYETFVDGYLQSKEDQTDKWIGHEVSFLVDYTMIFGGCLGSWLYSHNYLMLHYSGFYQVAEVVLLTKERLLFQIEFLTSGIPFFQDKSGTHCFWVYEYQAR